MNTCQSRTGIFTLKECGASSAASCAECGKPVCFTHYRLYQGSPYCVECYAARDAGADEAEDGTGEQDWELERARRRGEAGSADNDNYDDADYEVFDSTGSQGDLSDDSIPPDSFQDS